MATYDRLDAAILSAIGNGRATFTQIHSLRSIYSLTTDLSAESWKPRSGTTEPFRFLDRRLQALRKAGKIEFTGGSWVKAGSGE